MKRKLISMVIICVLTTAGFIGFISFEPEVARGDTRYVGGAGPGNYSSIQDAIDASINGDTVFVYSGTYYENITVNKTINLMGEERDITTIDGLNIRNVILITADWANVTGFTATNSGPSWSQQDCGIKLYDVTNVSVKNNKCTGNTIGMVLDRASRNTIDNNICNSNLQQGIQLRINSNENTISNGECKSNKAGIVLYNGCGSNTIDSNNASSNNPYHGINLDTSCHGNTIMNNDVYSNTDEGIYLLNNNDNNILVNNTVVSNGDHGIIVGGGSDNNEIYHNNIIGNSNQASDGGSGNTWDDGYPSGGNYWSDFDEPGDGAYDDYNGPNQDISGSDSIVDQGSGGGGGKNPYNIPGDSQDEYPFIVPINLPPTAPQNLQAATGDEFVNLTWNPPASTGGSAIIQYNIHRNGSAGIYDLVPGSQLWYNDTNVICGTTYTYTISALNSVGEGSKSVEVSGTPVTVPQAPQNLRIITSDGVVILRWEPPADHGGSPVTNYVIYRCTISGNDPVTIRLGDIHSYEDTDVRSGTTYIYRIAAENPQGEGPQSNEAFAQLPEEDEDLPWWFWILVAIIIALTIILLLVLLKSRKKEEEQPPSELQPFEEQHPPEEEPIQPDLSPPEPERPPPPPPQIADK
ncbi:MAG: fibronectin type III domain-containing protein [Thermoplasmata archaeon]|nr:MAG: fibronectin type III domain-containing protein [Thermoplasmata archaeon]